MTLGQRLQRAREEAGLSQSFVANVFNRTRQAVSQWESDKTEPNLTTLRSLARLYEVDFLWLVGEDDDDVALDEEVIQSAARSRAALLIDEKAEEWEREFRSLIRRMKQDFASGVPSEATSALRELDRKVPEDENDVPNKGAGR